MPDSQVDASRATRGVHRLAEFRERFRRRRGGWLAWRIGVTVVGVGIVAGGIVLLPLPGPGWLIIFAGLGVLGTEYEWARRLLAWLREQVRRWSAWVTRQSRAVQVLLGLAGLVLLAAIAYAAWLVYR